MRFAVLSDIHGNALALEAVLSDIDRQGVDAILNLGDHFFGPLDPARTWDLLSAREMVSIIGNTDRYLMEMPAGRAMAGGLPREALDWLQALPATATHAEAITLTHGAPGSDEIYWLDREDGEGDFRASTSEEVEAELPRGGRTPLYCCGHTHVARIVTLDDGGIVFNPGSVGRPSFTMDDPSSAELLSPAAAYAVVERSGGHWHVNLRQVAYDNMAASALARAHGDAQWAADLKGGRQR